MKNEKIYNIWTEFITCKKYKKYFMSNEEEWNNKLAELKKYIDKYNKRPIEVNEEKKTLSKWLQHQQTNYKSREDIMKNQDIYNKWNEFINSEKYKKYFMSDKEVWHNIFNEVKKYIDANDKRPSCSDNNKDIEKIGTWITRQTMNYNLRESLMKYQEIYEIWKNFINDDKYKKYFTSNEDIWLDNFNKVKKYIDENDKRPSTSDKDDKIKFYGNWIVHSFSSYKIRKGVMKNQYIYNVWTEFVTSNKYEKYFISDEKKWNNHLEFVRIYIDKYDKRPSCSDENELISFYGSWICNQLKNYANKTQIMFDENIYNKWTEFITNEKYKKYFMSNEEEWQSNLNFVKKYIDENNKTPSTYDKNKDIKKLGNWISNQQKNHKSKEYIMKNSDIYDKWTEFITSEKYKKYFMSNEEEWQSNLNFIKKYIDENNKRPSAKNKDTKMLGKWLQHQITNYKLKEYIMKNSDIYDKWTEFINNPQYKQYFN